MATKVGKRNPFVEPLPNLLNLFKCDKCGDWVAVSGFPNIAPKQGHTEMRYSFILDKEELVECDGTVHWKGFVGG